ncbi:hypothetical protein [Spiroplasma cantharicola]|uniref:Transmembrane protein n=1 Tax=Spiroplasma cantharicola TaxID=362837 RepID=A0A0M5KCE6_9MOLU|nr:hypothetical protein [Spiroplasma cantharicola]ALD66456.1 hypothetical protein SCANT_v1c05500 [Spiroplasma cantharicola]
MKIKNIRKNIDLNNIIVYSAIISLFAIFLLIPSVDNLRFNYVNSKMLIGIKLILGTISIISILWKFFSDYDEFMSTIDFQNISAISFKKILIKKNILAFLKIFILVSPLVIFTVTQGLNLETNINNIPAYLPNPIENIELVELPATVSKGIMFSLVNLIINVNKEISFGLSLIFIGSIFSLFALTFVYIAYRISMNKILKSINKTFNKIAKTLKHEELESYNDNLTEIIIELELKEKAIQYERILNLYNLLEYKETKLLKTIKKSIKKPEFSVLAI